MTIRDKLLSALSISGEMCDDCLSSSAAVKPRQSVNISCRAMVSAGVLRRFKRLCPRCDAPKLVNALTSPASNGARSSATAAPAPVVSSTSSLTRPWFWEGNVQDRITTHLMASGWKIVSSADTASRASGKDIVAAKAGDTLWVSVKGWPEKSVNVQARHWFSGALFDLVLYRTESADAKLALGLPGGFSTYRNLLPRVSWLQEKLPFDVYFVGESGEVTVAGVPGAR